MANDEQSLMGLRPLNQPQGNIQIHYYRANTAIAMFRYQPVWLNNSNQVAVAQIIDASGILGSIVGFLDLDKASIHLGQDSLADGSHLPASTDAFVAVADDPNQEFVCEADTGGGPIGTYQSGGATVLFTYLGTGTGNTTTGIANVLLDSSTTAADTGGVLKLIRPWDVINSDGTTNDATLNFAKWVVKINAHQNAPGRGYSIADRAS